MLDERGQALYVGKARSLKKRVVTYAHTGKLPLRLQRMVATTASMEVIRTHTEAEALLLESNLIKKLKPRYNILLRDDKSFPYILIADDHAFPQLKKHRGARKVKGSYFGPFAGAGAVNRTIATLQRVFKLRNCNDSVFAQRTRPCLQYHIKRCTAPCVGKVSESGYAAQVEQARAFLSGESRSVQEQFAREMQKASDVQDYETAAEYRDRIRALTAVQARQDINIEGIGDADVLALVQKGGKSCVQVFFFRAGQNFGGQSYFPRHDSDDVPEKILSVFLAQFYENKPVPPQIYASHEPAERELLEEALATRIATPRRGKRKRLTDFVLKNAEDALSRHLREEAGQAELLDGVADLFGLETPPGRIEVYDNSHISGTNMVGAMIVAGPEGFRKNAYRKFNIREADAGDDYGMMREVMSRRFGRLLSSASSRRKPDSCSASPEDSGTYSDNDSFSDWPDLVLIDGGKGQLGAVREALEEIGIWDDLTVVAIAKGPDRNAGREQFFLDNRKMFQLPENSPVLHYLQRLRDEAHRFAIGAHRARRKEGIKKSPLDTVPGIGAARKKALLMHFGSAKAVAEAGLHDLEQVEGISKTMAAKIYDRFHEQ